MGLALRPTIEALNNKNRVLPTPYPVQRWELGR